MLKLLEGYKIGLVTDAGTPCISDPGFRLVKFIRERAPKAEIEVVRGPSSVAIMVTAGYLSSNFEASKFLSGYFEGFSKVLFGKNPVLDYGSFAIYFENAKRLPKTLAFIEHLYGENQRMYIAGEISKRYERRYNGRVGELREYLRRGVDHPEGKEKLVGEMSYFLYPKSSENVPMLRRTEFEVDPTAVAAILNDTIELKGK
jgi:16S rRNA (cytidine1402-2'-O)-methyltransferase